MFSKVRVTPTILFLLSLATSNLAVENCESAERERLAASPVVEHLSPSRVSISWQGGRASIEYGKPGEPLQNHEVIRENPHAAVGMVTAWLDDLEPGQRYAFRIRFDDTSKCSKTYYFDSSCDLAEATRVELDVAKAPLPATVPGRVSNTFSDAAARKIAEAIQAERGYALILGCTTGDLAIALATQTQLQVICVEPDAARVAAIRHRLDKMGLYGLRVSVHRGPLDELPYVDRFANVVTSETLWLADEPTLCLAEICRVLHPYGGIALLGCRKSNLDSLRTLLTNSPLDGWHVDDAESTCWVSWQGGPIDGAGEWTHLYAEPGNSACSNDQLKGPMRLQWFGRPGPRHMTDRHHRGMAPLSKNGRLFIVGDDRLKAVDAYNGAALWDLTVPNSRRVCVHRDSGQMVVGEDQLYLAVENTCRVFDVATGRWDATLRLPGLEALPGESAASDRPSSKHWGYLALADRTVFGSVVLSEASYHEQNRTTVERFTHWDDVPMVTSQSLFGIDTDTQRYRWIYHSGRGRVVLNSTIAIGRKALAFVETHDGVAAKSIGGRIALKDALADEACLTALDRQSGRTLWRRNIDLSSIRHALYLSHAQETFLLTGTHNEGRHPRYDLLAFSAQDGRPLWSNYYIREDKPAGGDHGEQDQHPVIIERTIYSRPAAFDLLTGERRPFGLDRAGHGCGTLSGSQSYLFGRGGNPQMYPLDAEGRKANALTTISRPGCWINMIPAGGLLAVPESSSGCSCPFAVQSSMVFSPCEQP